MTLTTSRMATTKIVHSKLKSMNNYSISEVHISTIRVGDTILHTDGKIRTISRNNIKHDPFYGTTLFGDCYKLGYQKVKKITYKTARV